MKTKKSYYFLIFLVVIAGVGVYFYQKANKAVAPVTENSDKSFDAANQQSDIKEPAKQAENTTTPLIQPKSEPKPESGSKPVFSDGSEMEGLGPDVLVAQVDYDGTKFSPAELNLKLGDIVIFKNLSKQDFWPASDPHPSHTAYPEFDAKKAIAGNGSFQFKFLKAGNWAYHNHLNPSAKGVINVAK